MDIEGGLHLVWETDDYNSGRRISPIKNGDIKRIMKGLEGVESLSSVLSGLQDEKCSSRFDENSLNGSSLSYAFFGIPIKGGINGRGYLTEGFRRVSPLFLPYGGVLGRGEMMDRRDADDCEPNDREIIVDTLNDFRDTSCFLERKDGDYEPISLEDVRILNKYQLG